ncbi:hypothetical protein [Janibacter anophelis]|nr:hypothetical protein [Janibacter anophelis]
MRERRPLRPDFLPGRRGRRAVHARGAGPKYNVVKGDKEGQCRSF